MNNTVENDFLGFPEVKWLHLTGEVSTAPEMCGLPTRPSMKLRVQGQAAKLVAAILMVARVTGTVKLVN